MINLNKTFLFFSLLSIVKTYGASNCEKVNYYFAVKGKKHSVAKMLCKKKIKKLTLIYSPDCLSGNCHLIKSLKDTKYKPKLLLGRASYGAPQYRKCRTIDGKPVKVSIDKSFYSDKTMLCISKVDGSILNTTALFRWQKYWN